MATGPAQLFDTESVSFCMSRATSSRGREQHDVPADAEQWDDIKRLVQTNFAELVGNCPGRVGCASRLHCRALMEFTDLPITWSECSADDVHCEEIEAIAVPRSPGSMTSWMAA